MAERRMGPQPRLLRPVATGPNLLSVQVVDFLVLPTYSRTTKLKLGRNSQALLDGIFEAVIMVLLFSGFLRGARHHGRESSKEVYHAHNFDVLRHFDLDVLPR